MKPKCKIKFELPDIGRWRFTRDDDDLPEEFAGKYDSFKWVVMGREYVIIDCTSGYTEPGKDKPSHFYYLYRRDLPDRWEYVSYSDGTAEVMYYAGKDVSKTLAQTVYMEVKVSI